MLFACWSKAVGMGGMSRMAAALRSCPHPSCLQQPTPGAIMFSEGKAEPLLHLLLPWSSQTLCWSEVAAPRPRSLLSAFHCPHRGADSRPDAPFPFPGTLIRQWKQSSIFLHKSWLRRMGWSISDNWPEFVALWKEVWWGGSEEDWELWVFALGCKSSPPPNDNVPFPALEPHFTSVMENAALRSEGHKCLLLRLAGPPGSCLCDPVHHSAA